MVYVSLTRLRVRSLRFMPLFLWRNHQVTRQLKRAEGFLAGKLLVDRKFTFWTLSAWSDAAAMKAFRNGGAHLKAMPKLLDWCDEASVAHWTQEDDANTAKLPDWSFAHERMMTEGRVSKVRHPSPQHSDLKLIPAPRTTLENKLKPTVR